MDKNTFSLLYKAMVRPILEYANAVWCLYKKGDIEIIEKKLKRARKLLISLKHLSYSERLKQLQLPTLKFRRLRGDMIQVSKMVHKYYDGVSLKDDGPTGQTTGQRGSDPSVYRGSITGY